jgi:hypothetical protein
MAGSGVCPQCGTKIAADAAWCGKCGYQRGAPVVAPVGRPTVGQWGQASAPRSAAGDGIAQRIAGLWRGLSGRGKIATGAAVVVAILVLAAIGGSGANGSASDSSSASGPGARLGVTLTTSSATTAQTVASASAAPSGVDVDDESSASAGASFVPSATGVLPTTTTGSVADRLPGEPDPALTPGALNPAVTQATIHTTICVSGWTATIRPPESFTDALKVKQIAQYAYIDTSTSDYEEDHLISLELGGAPADARNLWPEPYTDALSDGRSTGARTKDEFETKLKTEVCAGTITLAQGQADIGDHWVHAYYGIALAAPSPTPAASPTPAPTPTPAKPKPTTLAVQITSLPASIGHGTYATLEATTSPGATCSVKVKYHSGTISTAAGLKLKPVADSSGDVSWTWLVGSSTKPGTSTATVTCTLGGRSASKSKTFSVS